jgi:hypothetical protein
VAITNGDGDVTVAGAAHETPMSMARIAAHRRMFVPTYCAPAEHHDGLVTQGSLGPTCDEHERRFILARSRATMNACVVVVS